MQPSPEYQPAETSQTQGSTPPGEPERAREARELDAIESAEELYDEQGSVPLHSPVMQGDVFTELDVPCLSSRPCTVMVVSHPCTMRKGADLRPRITVVKVTGGPRQMDADYWAGNYNVMPLPELLGAQSRNYMGDFREITAMDSSSLTLERRVATLTHQGVLLLQQRYVCAHTRLVVDLPTLHEQAESVLTEMDLQRDWVEAGMEATADTLDAMTDCIRSFHEWLDEDDQARRKKLKSSLYYADLRRETKAEIRARFK